jgi:hypothetical protein
LQNPPKVSAHAHRHYLSDNAEPMLNARECRVACGVIRNSIARPLDASVRRASVMTVQAPDLPTIVPESNVVSTPLLSVPAAQLRSEMPQIKGKLRHPYRCE